MSDFVETLKVEFRDTDYRHAYSTEFVDSQIATQIKVLREQRGWSQATLAEKAGMLQSRISALENVNYSAWSISTLRRLAKAFNVVLVVRFESFGKHLQEIEDFGRESLKVDSFASDAMVRGGGAVIDLIESLRISLQKRGVRYTAPARVISANTVGVSRTSGLASSTDSTGGYLDQPLTSRRRLAAGSRR